MAYIEMAHRYYSMRQVILLVCIVSLFSCEKETIQFEEFKLRL